MKFYKTLLMIYFLSENCCSSRREFFYVCGCDFCGRAVILDMCQSFNEATDCMKKRVPIFKLLLVFGLLFWSASLVGASVFTDLKILEKAVNATVARLESEISIDEGNDENFYAIAARQLQLTLLSFDAGHLLREDYFNLSLYFIARQSRQYQLALELLQRELKQADARFLKEWLQAKITALEILLRDPDNTLDEFSAAVEFSDLRSLLRKNNIR